jgi:SAM-dependent methyltransferase
MLAQWAPLEGARVLVAGCGVGMYAHRIRERFTERVQAFDIEIDRVRLARRGLPGALVSAAEDIPFADSSFDVVLSHEVIEHVRDDRRCVREMLRVTRSGGRIVLFCPNRWYPFETHGHYWHGEYHFGNTPLINYLPKRWRDKLAPHARAYTAADLMRLLDFDCANITHASRIYGGYDNIIARLGPRAIILRDFLHRLENTALDTWALSHFVVVEKR